MASATVIPRLENFDQLQTTDKTKSLPVAGRVQSAAWSAVDLGVVGPAYKVVQVDIEVVGQGS